MEDRGPPTEEDRLGLFTRFVRGANLARSEAEVLGVAARYTSEILKVARASIALLDPSGEFCDVVALDGDSGALPVGKKLAVRGTMIGEVIERGDVVIVNDALEVDYSEIRVLAKHGRSFMDAPLISGGVTFGTLNSMRVPPWSFDKEEATTIANVAAIVASNLEGRRLFEKLERNFDDVSTQARVQNCLYELAKNLDRSRNETDVASLTTQAARNIVGAERVSIALLNPDATGLDIIVANGEEISISAGTTIPTEGTMVGLAVQAHRTLTVADLENHPRPELLDCRALLQIGLRCSMWHPPAGWWKYAGHLQCCLPSAQPARRRGSQLPRARGLPDRRGHGPASKEPGPATAGR